ncbi:MAG: hypothetical protein HY289_00555 [Planctomycetes bacterium]|nr:hypothetical protein [Planctomycetota bacterium]
MLADERLEENPMSATTTIQQLNRELADKIVSEAKRDPQSPYLGKFVGIANGDIVLIADRMNELGPRLRQAEPDRSKTYWIEIAPDGSEVYHIWGGF